MRFTKEQALFLKEELGIEIAPNEEITLDPQLKQKIAEFCMDTETSAAGNELYLGEPFSKKGEIAASIVDLTF